MKGYVNQGGHRLSLKFIDGDTNELLFEIKDKSWMEIGQFMTNGYVTEIVRNSLGLEDAPENLVVMTVAYFEKR